MGWMMGPWAWGAYGGWGMALGMFIPWLLLAGLVWLFWSLASRRSERGAALEALQLRYVRGEVTRDEYQTLRKDLRA